MKSAGVSSALACLAVSLAMSAIPASTCAADPVPTLNDILNASQLDVRSSESMPRPQDARVVEVRADSPLRQLFRTGENVTRLSSISIWFSGWSPDWTPEKSLALRIYAGQDLTRVLATAVEPYSQRLWEGAVHVFTLNLPVAANSNYTFELTTRGGVTLTGAALAPPPFGEGVGPLASNGDTLPGALWFETAVKRRSNLDRLYLDVFHHFDLNRPDMRAVRDGVATRDWEAAKRALVAHFEGRKELFPPDRPRQSASDPSARTVIAEADLAVQHRVRAGQETVDLGPRWNHRAAWPTRGGVGLTRAGLRGTLAAAYSATGDEKYARAWDEMLRFEFEDLPSPLRTGTIAPDAKEIPPVGFAGIEGGSMWASLSIAARMSHGFAYYSAFRHSPNFTLDTRFAFIANLAEMSDVLERMRGGGNWQAQNTTALLDFGRTFPEFQHSGQWQVTGFSGALESCLDNSFPDGALREASTNYDALSLGRYLGVLEAARDPSLGLGVSPEARARVEKMCDYLLFSSMPNGQLPLWGDSNPPLDGAAILGRGAELFGRQDLRWASAGGKTGAPPSETSRAFPDSGYYIMRSGWNSDATFLDLHNGESSAHGHRDANSLVLAAFGNQLLIDPGVYIYGTPEATLLARTVSHNTVTVDDLDTVNGKGDALWVSGWWSDLYDGTNAGYEGLPRSQEGARHRRIALFLKPGLAFVVDQGKAEEPHDWTLRFHFAPGELAGPPDGKYLRFDAATDAAYHNRSGAGLRIWSAPNTASHLTAAPGLASGGWERKIEAPVANWPQFRTPEAHWASLLEPFGAAPSSAAWDVRQDANGTAMAFQRDYGATRLLLIRPDADAPMPDDWVHDTGFTTDAQEAAFESLPGSGAALRAASPSGASAGAGSHSANRAAPGSALSAPPAVQAVEQALARSGKRANPATVAVAVRRLMVHSGSLFLQPDAEIPAILHADEPVTFLEASWRGDTVAVRRIGGAGIVLRTYSARRLLIDGKTIAIPAGAHTVRLPDAPPSKEPAQPYSSS